MCVVAPAVAVIVEAADLAATDLCDAAVWEMTSMLAYNGVACALVCGVCCGVGAAGWWLISVLERGASERARVAAIWAASWSMLGGVCVWRCVLNDPLPTHLT